MESVIETWLEIPFYQGYMVSDLGRVMSIKKNRVLKQFERWKRLKNGGRRKKACFIALPKRTFPIHRLVMMVFKPNANQFLSIDHIGRDPFNNRLSNLRWATRSEQSENRDNKRASVKITMEDLNNIVMRAGTESLPKIAIDYGMTSFRLSILLNHMHPHY